MPWARAVRIGLSTILIALGLWWVLRSDLKPERVSLFVTAVIGAVTAIYALVTYEILIQNQMMAKAALDSSTLMERSLRFSHAANLLFETMSTKDPTFASTGSSIAVVDNRDYRRALTEFNEGGEQKEFVFAVIRNRGQGTATNLSVEVTYNITDNSGPNRESTVTKRASLQALEPKAAVALCVFISKLPTPGDQVSFIGARLSAGDFYRDAISEPPLEMNLEPRAHHTQPGTDCVVRLV